MAGTDAPSTLRHSLAGKIYDLADYVDLGNIVNGADELGQVTALLDQLEAAKAALEAIHGKGA